MSRMSGFFAGWLVLVPVHAVWAGPADGLGDLLVKKGVITADELKSQQKTRSLVIDGRIQARYSWQENDDPKDNRSEFSLHRVRLGVGGYAFPNVTYKVELDAVPDTKQKETITVPDPATGATATAKGDVQSASKITIKDVKATFWAIEHAPVTIGHFKVPFSRQQLASSLTHQMVNRAEVSETTGEAQGRDVGVMIGDYAGKAMFEYAVGAFNGTRTSNLNDNGSFLWAARLATNPLGEFGYDETNLEKANLKVSLGLNAMGTTATAAGTNNKLDFAGASDDRDTDVLKYGADFGVRFLGIASIFAEYIAAKYEPKGSDEFDANGWYVQGGVFVLPQQLELAARFEQYDPNDGVDNTADITWTTVGFNYYFYKHDLKFQANYVMRGEDDDPVSGEDKDDDAVLVQVQLRY